MDYVDYNHLAAGVNCWANQVDECSRSRAGDHLTPRAVQKILNTISKRSTLNKPIHSHLLCHSFAMWSLDSGVPIYDLQKQLGHASLAATGIYLEASPNHRRESYMRSEVASLLVGKPDSL